MNSTWIFFFPYFCPFLGCRKIRAKFSWIFLRFGVKQYCIKISINLIFSLDDEWSMFDSKNVIKMRVLNGLFSLQNPQTLVIIWWNLFLKRKLAKKLMPLWRGTKKILLHDSTNMYWRKKNLLKWEAWKKLNWVPQIISPFFVPEKKKKKLKFLLRLHKKDSHLLEILWQTNERDFKTQKKTLLRWLLHKKASLQFLF